MNAKHMRPSTWALIAFVSAMACAFVAATVERAENIYADSMLRVRDPLRICPHCHRVKYAWIGGLCQECFNKENPIHIQITIGG